MDKSVRSEKKIKAALNRKCACYVLITCSEPNSSGEMDVEMNYEGDETLAAYLVENAAEVFGNHQKRRESQ